MPRFCVSFVYAVNLNKCHCPLDESINQLSHTIKRCTSSVWKTAHMKNLVIKLILLDNIAEKLKTGNWHMFNAQIGEKAKH